MCKSSVLHSCRPFNIHRDSLPLEAQKVLPILTEIQNRVQELLNEWPDHPVLQQVCSLLFLFFLCRHRIFLYSNKSILCPLAYYRIAQINRACEKVLLLGVNEPLMKILSGLEYVLKKAQVSFVLLSPS